MTIEGAIAELQNLIKADDVPFYYNGAIQKVIETIIDERPVRCGECSWYEPRHVEENGIKCAGQCIWHIGLKTYCDAHNREDLEDRPRMIIFREPTDFCSYGERRADEGVFSRG